MIEQETIKYLQERIKFLEGIINLQNETNAKLIEINSKLVDCLNEKESCITKNNAKLHKDYYKRGLEILSENLKRSNDVTINSEYLDEMDISTRVEAKDKSKIKLNINADGRGRKEIFKILDFIETCNQGHNTECTLDVSLPHGDW